MGMQIGSFWQSAAYPVPERNEAWRNMLNSTYGAWDLRPTTPPEFDAQMTYHSVGGFQVVDCTCDPCGAVRTRADINRDGRETITIQVMLEGREHLTLDKKSVILGAGDVVIWNTLRPMSFEVIERLRKISVTMPLARLRSWLPSSWHSIECSLPHVSPGAGLLSSVIGSLSPAFLAGNLRNGEALTESVMGLLVNVLGIDHGLEPATLRESQLLLIKRYIAANLSEPDLTPTRIAEAKRISVRYLHALFESEGTTVQQHIIAQRLTQCRRELQNPRTAGRTITDIAFSWGFQNSSHFSRRFRDAFGMSPQEFRCAAARENAASA